MAVAMHHPYFPWDMVTRQIVKPQLQSAGAFFLVQRHHWRGQRRTCGMQQDRFKLSKVRRKGR